LNATEHVAELLDNLPVKTGVYIMKDEYDRVLYVGKAVNLRSRVRSYFQEGAEHGERTRLLVDKVRDIDYVVTDSEVEALALESNLIKEYSPRYNVKLKDDKSYPFVKITASEPFPRVFVTRKVVQDGSIYFGPYTDVTALRDTIDVVRKVFSVRSCHRRIDGETPGARPCLNYHIRRCLAPCTGAVTPEEYNRAVREVVMFLEGRSRELVKAVSERMDDAARRLDFERAATLRDQLRALESVTSRQKVVSDPGVDRDVIALARDDKRTCAVLFYIRDGLLIGREHFMLEPGIDDDDSSLVTAFLQQYYSQAAFVPREILLSSDVQGRQTVERWLRTRRGGAVVLAVPRRGEKRRLVEMAQENAAEILRIAKEESEQKQFRLQKALLDLKAALSLADVPKRIECYDISNTQGTDIVASMAVFDSGEPRRSHYRRFRIRDVEGPDDFESMRQVIRRRMSRLAREGAFDDAEPSRADEPGAFETRPDLIVVDGGKGQLSAALSALEQLGIAGVPVISLAKREEEVFVPGRSDPVVLDRESEALFLLQRIRDEAHRFALAYHRRLRGKRALGSILEEVPGIGPKKRKALLERFTSIEGLRRASIASIAELPGITEQLARDIKEYLNR
jgi:excinuclease ABC subunit C